MRGDTLKTSHCNGFTLAEVLITLGIIGIVAAVTIPALVSGYKKKVFVTKMKYWDFPKDYAREDLFVQKYFEPYMHILESGYEETGVNYYIKLKNGVTLSWQLDGDTQNGGLPTALYILASTNGKTSWIGESD